MSEWISVKDKLPNENEDVLIFGKIGTWHTWLNKKDSRQCVITCGYWSNENRDDKRRKIYPIWKTNCECFGYGREREFFDITHWMPLPSIPMDNL